MTTLRFLVSAVSVLAASMLPPHVASTVQATAGTGGSSSTREDQVDLALTVYNGDLALVRDVREVRLAGGTTSLRFVDVAATINPATVHLRSLSDAARLRLIEQNYEYDLLDPDKLLRKYVGRTVTLVRDRVENGTTRQQEVTATLVSYNNAPIWKVGEEYVTGLGSDHLRFPDLPDNLYTRPTLLWILDNQGTPRHRVEASYLATGLSWQADYVLTVSRDDTRADLDGWVTLSNTSGATFPQARLQLVAGDLNRVRPEPMPAAIAQRAMTLSAEAADMRQESFGEYHLYTLARRTTIGHNETKQLALLSGSGVPVTKRFVVTGQPHYYRDRWPGLASRQPVQVFYRFSNTSQGGLGLPMPAGTVRVYQADGQGALQLVGEDRIAHTPKDETIDLKIGHAFDVVCERKQVGFEKIGDRVYEAEFEITLRNRKDSAIAVEVHEPIGGTWRMLHASHRWEKTDAWAARFDVPVAAAGTSVLTYRVRLEW